MLLDVSTFGPRALLKPRLLAMTDMDIPNLRATVGITGTGPLTSDQLEQLLWRLAHDHAELINSQASQLRSLEERVDALETQMKR